MSTHRVHSAIMNLPNIVARNLCVHVGSQSNPPGILLYEVVYRSRHIIHTYDFHVHICDLITHANDLLVYIIELSIPGGDLSIEFVFAHTYEGSGR